MAELAPPRPRSYDDTFWKPISMWLTKTDHKLIGIMYMTTGILSFVVAGLFALLMRIQLSQPNLRVIDAEAYNDSASAGVASSGRAGRPRRAPRLALPHPDEEVADHEGRERPPPRRVAARRADRLYGRQCRIGRHAIRALP